MCEQSRKLSVIGYGNMAKAIVSGILSSGMADISHICLFDQNVAQYDHIKSIVAEMHCCNIEVSFAKNVCEAVNNADCVLLSVKPQNYPIVLSEIKLANEYEKKLYISIAAGITSESVSETLGGACVVRVLPNLPILIGQGSSVICNNESASSDDFNFVCDVFKCASSVITIDETEMNRIIGVTSSSPAYVFKFINAIYKGAQAQGLDGNELLSAICDMVIGSATMLKQSTDTPEELITKVASKGGTTERALLVLDDCDFDKTIEKAMIACTKRADELGSAK